MRLRFCFTAGAVVLGVMLTASSASAACPAEWTIVPSPEAGSYRNALKSVAASGRNDVWAVGTQMGTRGFQRRIAMHWDGDRWKLADLPNPKGQEVLSTITHIPGSPQFPARRFLAAGWHGPGHTYILDGAQGEWSYSPQTDRDGVVNGSAARRSGDAWLVGSDESGPLALHRTDGRWRSVEVPHSGSVLEDVDMRPGGGHAWAVGSSFVLRWGNGHWADVGGPFGSLNLTAVEVIARRDVWVAGTRFVGESDQETFLAHWDGANWEISPTGTGRPGWLKGLAVVDSSDIWAVGDSETLHWDGLSWQVVPKGFTGGQLHDITQAPGSSVLWAVGQRRLKTLTLRYCG